MLTLFDPQILPYITFPYVLLRQREKMRLLQLLLVSESRHSARACSLRHARDTHGVTISHTPHTSSPTRVYPDGAGYHPRLNTSDITNLSGVWSRGFA